MSSGWMFLLGLATPFVIVALVALANRLRLRARRIIRAGKFPSPLVWKGLSSLLSRLDRIGWDIDMYGVGLGRFGIGVFVGTKRKKVHMAEHDRHALEDAVRIIRRKKITFEGSSRNAVCRALLTAASELAGARG